MMADLANEFAVGAELEKLCGTRSTAEIPRNMVDAVVQELRLVGGAVPK